MDEGRNVKAALGPVAFGAALTLLGVGFVLASADYGYMPRTGQRLPAGFMPGIGGAILAVSGTVLMVRAWLEAGSPADDVAEADAPPPPRQEADGADDTEAPGPSVDDPDKEQSSPARAMAILALLAGAVALSTWIGLLEAIAVFIFVLLVVVERISPLIALLYTVVVIAIGWLVFAQLLNIPIPSFQSLHLR